MPEKNAFNPDWVSPPGATITDILDAQSYSVAEFAKRMAFTPRQADDLLAGRLAISPEIARKLELVLGATTEFWMIRESQYRGSVAGHQREAQSQVPEDWLSELPLRDMRRFGWLDPNLAASDPVFEFRPLVPLTHHHRPQ